MLTRSQFGCPAAILMLAALLAPVLPGDAGPEDELKSATLLAFLQNAHWAEELAANTPLTVGVVGRAAFLRRLHASIDGKSVNGHPLRIVSIGGLVDSHCCQAFYFATDKSAEIKPALQSLASSHVLTIGETDGFLAEGGAVNLFLIDGHMAFEVSLNALERAGIEISSKLLRFGQIRDLARGRTAQ